MKRLSPMNRLFVVVAAVCAFLPVAAFACGQERWPVKVVQDKHRKYFFKDQKISTRELVDPVQTSVYQLSRKAWPFSWAKSAFPDAWANRQRAGQAEFTIWVLTATLLKKKNEDDQDYHLVIKSGTRKMIAEIPSPDCLDSTPEPIKSMVIQARSDFDTWFDQQPDKVNLNTRVRITGMGFFDRVHGNAEGQVKKNGIELHPVIKIEFLD
jgi:hypothetical protein